LSQIASPEVTKITRHTVPNFLNFTMQKPVDAVIRPTSIQELSYKLPNSVTFPFIPTFDRNFVFFTEWRHVDRQCEA